MRGTLVAAALVALLASSSSVASASTALDLVLSARTHEKANQEELALRRYMEALSLDPTCDEAYLGLGSLRARRGDLREAERVYSVALEHRPQLRDALVARSFVRRALGATPEAIADLLGSAGDTDVGALRTIAAWFGEDGQTPAQLAAWRKIAVLAEHQRDNVLQAEARTMIRALLVLVGTADPVIATSDAGPLRQSLRMIARRPRP